MIVLSDALALALQQSPDWSAENNPLFGWRTIATADRVSASASDPLYPATNVANPATFLKWKGTSTGLHTLQMSLGSTEGIFVDYVGLARHNLGTMQIPTSVEAIVDGEWVNLVGPQVFADDKPVIFRLTGAPYTDVRVKMEAGVGIPEIAVMYIGQLLVLQRRVYVNHTPMVFGRNIDVVNGMSDNGNYLGEIILGETLASSLSLQNLTPAWYRSNLDPVVAQRKPFFFAWRPHSYPQEISYAWITNNPVPTNQRSNGMMQIQLQLAGIS